MPEEQTAAPYTRRTSRRVYVTDRVAGVVISIGGLAAIAAILGIVIQLVSVSASLFFSGDLRMASAVDTPGLADAALIRFDEHRTSALAMHHDGGAVMVNTATGEIVASIDSELDDAAITAIAWSPSSTQIALGLSDGRYLVGDFGFKTRYLEEGHDDDSLNGVVAVTPIGQRRATLPDVNLARPKAIKSGDGPVVLIDHSATARGEVLVTVRAHGAGALHAIRRIVPLDGSAPRLSGRSYDFALEQPAGAEGLPRWCFIVENGASVVLLWPNGVCQRYDTSDYGAIKLAETLRVVEEGRRVTAATLMIGDRTVAIGDDGGGVGGWFTARTNSFDTPDGQMFVKAHTLRESGPAVRQLAVSPRDRQIAITDENGVLTVRHMTSHAHVGALSLSDQGAAIDGALRILPKSDAVAAVDLNGRTLTIDLNPAHPEASVTSLFGKVWYEGEPEPAFIYQSSSGDDAAEPKLSLVPLITGTLKATVYTMLIAAPIAIFAALCSAEFLSKRIRSTVKPGIEMMASLPSVVMGFIAAMILAPLVNDYIPGVLLMFAGVPMGVLLAAHLWQFVPVRYDARTGETRRLLMVAIVGAASFGASIAAGPVFESLLFRPTNDDKLILAGSYEPIPQEQWPAWVGRRDSLSADDGRKLREIGLAFRDGSVVRPVGSVTDPEIARRIEAGGYDRASIRAWLDGVIGGPWPGWFIVGLPAAAILVGLGRARLGVYTNIGSRSPMSSLLMFIASLAAMVGLAAIGGAIVSALGFDARDSILGPYQQRNSLVVGIAMAVAVIPIIYTITDDALTSVPDSLRSASLGAGASKWQTAVRVVLPAAGSGVFSALMIGLGRAVGETMIVLMATGNTPIMDINIFEGFRTLSANIAVELPEAPRGGTHYRLLFLCGVCLLVMTLVVNTSAEVVRQRFRKRSSGL